MAGILDFLGFNDTPQGGILAGAGGQAPAWANKVGLFGAGLADAGAALAGKPASNLDNFSRQMRTQQLLGAINSQDPTVRGQAYSAALAMGIDPTPFQKAQASQALPQLMQNLQPSMGFNDNPVGVTPAANTTGPGVDAARAAALQTNAGPSMSMQPATFAGALQRTGSPELTAEMAPQLIQQQMNQQAKAVHRLSPQEAVAAGYPADAPVYSDQYGNLSSEAKPTAVIRQTQDANANAPITPYQAAVLKKDDATQAETRRHNQAQEGGESGGGLSDAAKVNAAVKFNLTGTLPAFGMGKAARQDRLEVMNYAAQLATGKKSPEQLVTDAANFKANSASLNQLTKQFNVIEQNSNAANNSLNLALKSAKDGGTGPTDSPVFNRWVQAGRVAINGDPKVQALQNHLGTFAEEYAKVMTASTGSAAATDSARAEAYKRLSAANSYENMLQIAGEMRKEMGGRHYAARSQIEGVQKQLGGGDYSQPNGVQTPAPVDPSKLPRIAKPGQTKTGVKFQILGQ